MAEYAHQPAHPAQSDHNVEHSLLRRKSREAGRSEGNDGGLAGHLERLSKQLDNIQAEHSQLFHNRQPDRDNLAKSTARFLSHNGRQGPSSRPAAIDQADISLQAAAAVSASSRRSFPANAPPPSRKGSTGGSGTGGSPGGSTPPSPRPSNVRLAADHSSLMGEQDLRRCQSATSRMPPFTQAPAPAPSPSPSPGAGSAARRLHWQEPSRGPEHHQQYAHTHVHRAATTGSAPVAHSRFAAEQQHGRAAGAGTPLGEPSGAASASPTRSGSSRSSASQVSGASLRQLLPQERTFSRGQHDSSSSSSSSSAASSVSTERSLQEGLEVTASQHSSHSVDHQQQGARRQRLHMPSNQSHPPMQHHAVSLHPGPPAPSTHHQHQEQRVPVTGSPSQGCTFPSHHASPQPLHPSFAPPPQQQQQQQQQQHAAANKMRVLPADVLLSPASSSGDTGGVAAAVGSECSYSSTGSSSSSGSTVRSGAVAQHGQQGPGWAPAAGRAAAGAGAPGGDEAQGPLRQHQQQQQPPPLNSSSFTQAGSSISRARSGSSGSYGCGDSSFSSSSGGGYSGGSDLASRMAAGRARRALRNASATQGHAAEGTTAAAPAPAATAASSRTAIASSGNSVQLEAGARSEDHEDHHHHHQQQQQQQEGTYAPTAAGMPALRKLPLHTEDWQRQQQSGVHSATPPSSSRVRTARQSAQGYAGGDAGQGGVKTREQEEEEEGALADQGHARKRHRVSELPDSAAPQGPEGGYGVHGGAGSGTGDGVHSRLTSRGDGGSGSGSYVGWAPTLPPVSHALDPCPTSPSPCSSSSPPTGTLSLEDAPASQQSLHESASLLPLHSSSEDSREQQPQPQQQPQGPPRVLGTRHEGGQGEGYARSSEEGGGGSRLGMSSSMGSALSSGCRPTGDSGSGISERARDGSEEGNACAYSQLPVPAHALPQPHVEPTQRHAIAQQLQSQDGHAPQEEQPQPQQRQAEQEEDRDQQLLLSLALKQQQQPQQRQAEQEEDRDQQLLLSLALKQQQQQQQQQHSQEGRRPGTPTSHPDANLLSLVAQLRRQHAQRVVGGGGVGGGVRASKTHSQGSDLPVLQVSAPVHPEAPPPHSFLQPAPVRAPPPAAQQQQQHHHHQQQQELQAPSPPRGHLSRFQADDSVLFGSPIRRPDSATAATAATSFDASVAPLGTAAATAPSAGANSAVASANPAVLLGGASAPMTAAAAAPSAVPMSEGLNKRATVVGESWAGAGYQPEPRVVLYEPSRYQDEEAEEEDKPLVGSQEQQQQQQQQPAGAPELDASGGEGVRMSLTLRPGQLAGFQAASQEGSPAVRRTSESPSHAHRSTPASPPPPSPTRAKLQEGQQQQQQPAPLLAHFPLATAETTTAGGMSPPPPLPKPTTWRAGEKPLPSPQHQLTQGSHALPFAPSQPPPSDTSKHATPLSSPQPHMPRHVSAASTPYASPYAAPSDMTIPGTQDHVPATPYAACSDVSVPMTPMTDATRLLSPSPPTHQAHSASAREQSPSHTEEQEEQANKKVLTSSAAGRIAEAPSGIAGHPIFSVACSDAADTAGGGSAAADASGGGNNRVSSCAFSAAASPPAAAAGEAEAPGGRGRSLPQHSCAPRSQPAPPSLQLPCHEETSQGTSPAAREAAPSSRTALHGRSPSPSASHDSRRSSKLFQLKERRQHQHGWEVWRHRSHSPGHSSLSPSASPSPSPPHQMHQRLQHADPQQVPAAPLHPPQPEDHSAYQSYPTDQQGPQEPPCPIPSLASSQPSTATTAATLPAALNSAASSLLPQRAEPGRGTAAAPAPPHLPQNLDLGHGPLGLSSSYSTPGRPGPGDGAGAVTGAGDNESAGKAWLPRVGAPIDSPQGSPPWGPPTNAAAGAGAAAAAAAAGQAHSSPTLGAGGGGATGARAAAGEVVSDSPTLGTASGGHPGAAGQASRSPHLSPASNHTEAADAVAGQEGPAPSLNPTGSPAIQEAAAVAPGAGEWGTCCGLSLPSPTANRSLPGPSDSAHGRPNLSTVGSPHSIAAGHHSFGLPASPNPNSPAPVSPHHPATPSPAPGTPAAASINPEPFGVAASSPSFSIKRPAAPPMAGSGTEGNGSGGGASNISIAPPIILGRGSADRLPGGHSGSASNIDNSSSGTSSPSAVQAPWRQQQQQQQQQGQSMRHGQQRSYNGDLGQPDRVMHFGGPHSHSFSHSPEGRPPGRGLAGPEQGSGTQQPQQQQEQEQQQRQQLHAVKRSAALLRLKQQCIQRHQPVAAAAAAASAGGTGGLHGGDGGGGSQYRAVNDGEAGVTDDESGSCSLRRAGAAGGGAAVTPPPSQGGKHAAAVGNLLGRLHEHRSARPLTPPAARPESSTRSSSGAGLAGSGAEGDGHAGSQGERAAGGGDGNESPDMTPKPFLKRKSRKVVGSKIDWSHVKPRTVSRLDYSYNPYTHQSADLSPPWSHNKQGVGKAKQQRAAARNSPTKQSQHLGSAGPKSRTCSAARSAAAAVRGSNDSWRPTHQDRSSAGAERSSISSNAARSSTVGTRPRGILPGADYECVRYTGIPYPSGNHLLTRPLSAGVGPDVSRSGTFGAQDQQLRTPPRSKGARGAAQAGVPGSPLDDLLVHVNSLLKDFDTRFAASSTPSRSGAVRGVPVTDFSVERANDVD